MIKRIINSIRKKLFKKVRYYKMRDDNIFYLVSEKEVFRWRI